MPTGPSKSDKLLFWIILGAYSTFFAEVLSGSDLFPFFHPWGVLAVVPLYGLHTLVLCTLVFRHGRPTLYTLFAAGILFGLYEAYITKVLWNPPFDAHPLRFAGVAVSEFVVLVFFWHPVMSFIVPSLLAETLLTGSRAIFQGLPIPIQAALNNRPVRSLLLILFTLLFGVFPIHGAESTLHALLAGLLNPAVLLLLTYLWHKKTHNKHYIFQMLLPGKLAFRILLLLLLSMYAGLGVLLRPEALPGFVPQAIIWVLYGVALWLLRASLRRSPKADLPSTAISPLPAPPYQLLIRLWLLFVLTITVSHMLLGSAVGLIVLAVWLGGGAIGMILLILTARDARQSDEWAGAADTVR